MKLSTILNFDKNSYKPIERRNMATGMKSQVISDCVGISTPQKHWTELINNLNSYIIPENFLGGGSEASVYKLNDNYVLRLYGGETTVKSRKFKPVVDIFEGRNFGQMVAISEDRRVSINKFVRGTPMYKCNETSPIIYLENLRRYSKLSDKTLEQFIENVSFINKKGYRIDESNPENFLYDCINQRIGIVDICKKGSTSLDLFGPYGHDWILDVLCNGHDFLDCASKMNPVQKKEMFDLITLLESRIIPLCKKYNIPLAKYNNEDYLHFSMAEFLSLKDKLDIFSKDGIRTQIVKLNHPEEIEKLKRMSLNF